MRHWGMSVNISAFGLPQSEFANLLASVFMQGFTLHAKLKLKSHYFVIKIWDKDNFFRQYLILRF